MPRDPSVRIPDDEVRDALVAALDLPPDATREDFIAAAEALSPESALAKLQTVVGLLGLEPNEEATP